MAEHPLWGSNSFRFLFPTMITIKSKVYPFLFKGEDDCVNPSQLTKRQVFLGKNGKIFGLKGFYIFLRWVGNFR